MTQRKDDPASKRSTWEPAEVKDVGHVGEILQGGGGKLSIVADDTGDIRKPKGQE
jgi:hypothetical protein